MNRCFVVPSILRTRLQLALAFAAVMCFESNIGAQSISTGATVKPTTVRVLRTINSESSLVSFVHELEDGRIIIVDKKEREVRLFSKTGADLGRIGRTGDGPSEYRSPASGFTLGSDSALLVDAQNSRWYFVEGPRLLEPSANLLGMQRKIGNRLDGISQEGHALTLVGMSNGKAGMPSKQTNWVGFADSVLVIESTISGKSDTIARLQGHFLGQIMVSVRINGAQDNFKITNPFSTYDQAVMFRDGAVAVARNSPYRVDWRTTDRQWVSGSDVREPSQPVSRSHRSRSAAGYLRNSDGTAVLSVDQFPAWPKQVPPFLARALLAGYDGLLYVRRTKIHPDDAQLVDVFDRNGRRVRQLQLPMRSELVGSGKSGLFVAVRDSDDVEHVIVVR